MKTLSTAKTVIKKDTVLLDWQKKFKKTTVVVEPHTSLIYILIQGLNNVQPRAIKITLKTGSELIVRTVMLGTDDQKLTSDMKVIHEGSHSTSRIRLSGAFFDSSAGIMNGSVLISKKCKNADTRLEERVLLLSDKARANAVPDLEILNDEVHASHAATVSNVNEDEIFYLESRGLTRSESIAAIVYTFLTSNLSLLPQSASRDTLETSILQTLTKA